MDYSIFSDGKYLGSVRAWSASEARSTARSTWGPRTFLVLTQRDASMFSRQFSRPL